MNIVDQDEDKRKIIKFVYDKLFSAAKSWKFLYSGHNQSRWISDIKWVKGQQYKNKTDDGKVKVAFNLAWANIQKELPFMTDRMPKIYAEPMEPSDKFGAEMFQMMIATKWVQRDMDKKIPEGTLNAKEVGTGFYRPFWNPELAKGLGDVDCEVIDPLEAFPFAYTSELSKEKTEGFIHARNVSVGWIKKNYKEGWRVKAWVDPAVVDRAKETAVKGRGDGYAQVGDIGTTTGYVSVETNYLPSAGSEGISETDMNRCTLLKCYLKDGSIKDEDKEGKKGNEKDNEKEAAYPNGRVITIAGGVVLEDEEFQWDFFPGFVEQRNYIQPSEFWGESDVTQIKDINKVYNKIFSTLVEGVRRGIYTNKFIDIRSGIDAEDYVVSEDTVYQTKISNPISESAPQAMPAQAFNMIGSLQQILNTISGTVDYTPPSGGDLPSGRSLAEMNEIAQIRLRQKIRNLEYSVRKIGAAWVEIMLKNYTEDRIMRLINPATSDVEWVFVFREKDKQKADLIRGEKSKEIIPGTEQIDPQTQQPVPESGTPKYHHILNLADIKEGFDLNVATGSTVSVAKYAAFDQSTQLFQMGAIDKQALLDSAEYPNRKDIMRRMDQAAQAGQQAQQEAMQAEQQLEQGKLQVESQGDQLSSQTTLQKTEMDNKNKTKIKLLELAIKEKTNGKTGGEK